MTDAERYQGLRNNALYRWWWVFILSRKKLPQEGEVSPELFDQVVEAKVSL